MLQRVEFAECLAAEKASQMKGTMAVQFGAALVLAISSAVNLYPPCLEPGGRNAANHGEEIPRAHDETRRFGP